MFLKCSVRRKDGKEHRSWSVVESQRLSRQRVVQRHVLYPGEINDSQRAVWEKTPSVFDDAQNTPVTCALFPDDRTLPAVAVGLMPRVVFEKLATMQRLDVIVPTTAGRELVMVRRTEPSRYVKLLVERLGWCLPEQPLPRLRTVAGRVEVEPM